MERRTPRSFSAEHSANFGGGPRVCIGNGFALMEARRLLATIAGHYRLERAPGHVVKPAPLITLNPQGRLPMIVRRRSAA